MPEEKREDLVEQERQDDNVKVTSDTSTKVRSNFPETWIWTDAVTGCVIAFIAVACCCTNTEFSKTPHFYSLAAALLAMQIAVLATATPSVRPFVCTSHAGTLSR